jgi:hypothetical protein
MKDENPYSSSQIRADRHEMPDWPVDDELESMMKARLLALRIIIFSLTAGVLSFGGFVAFQLISQNKPLNGWGDGSIGMIFFGIALFQIILSFVVPKIVASISLKQFAKNSANQSASSDKTKLFSGLFNILHTETIVRAALLEAAAFLCLTGVMLYQVMPLAIVAGVVIVLLLFLFPRYDATRVRLMQLLSAFQEA